MIPVDITDRRRSIQPWLQVSIFLLLAYFPLFLHLGYLPIRLWDESRLAINTYEMSHNGHYLVTYFDGMPDMWNTKPPLLIWMQVCSTSLFGMNETAIRLPSALAALFTAFFLLVFIKRYTRDYWAGLITSIILVTSYGFVIYHGARNGDYDSVLTLFMTAYALFFYLYLDGNKIKYLHLFFLMLALAILTKSIQALLFLPALGIFVLLTKNLRILSNKWFWIDLLICAGMIGLYYFSREQLNPGYMKAVWQNELGGRYASTIENHSGEFLYYYYNLKNINFNSWYLLVPAGAVIGWISRDRHLRRLTQFSLLLIFSYWLIISFGQTKLLWYDIPMFPFLSVLAAIPVYKSFHLVKTVVSGKNSLLQRSAPFLFLLLAFFIPYRKIVAAAYSSEERRSGNETYQICYFLRDYLKSSNDLQGQFVCFDGYNPHVKFYLNLLIEKNKPVWYKDWKSLNSGDMVITFQPGIADSIESRYKNRIIEEVKPIKIFEIDGTVRDKN